jgi:hypothetical protein
MRKAFLAPWHPMVKQIWLYSLADAQRETDVDVHYSGLFITHHHTDVTPNSDNLPEFTRRFHRDLSCGLHTLLCKEKYDAPRELFDDRPAHWTRLLDPEAQASRLVYDIVNAVAAGLVDRPEHMPMCFFDFGLWKTGSILVRRPPLYFGDDRPELQPLRLMAPPLLLRAFGGDIDALIYHMQRLVEHAVKRLRAQRKRPVLGAKKARRLHPWSEPRTMRESGPRSHLTFRVGANDILGEERRIFGAKEVRGFRQGHEGTRIARRDGDLEARYPFGTYAARVYRGAPVDDVALDAFVTAPGPLLADVEAELAAQRVARDDVRDSAHQISRAVREAFDNEAGHIADDAHLDIDNAHRTRSSGSSTTADEPHAGDDSAKPEADERPPAVVRHRFDRRRRDTARRVITLRDKRRGRPPGSDPPAD